MMQGHIFGAGINVPLLKACRVFKINNQKVLSVGCGSAALENVLEKKEGCVVWGIDCCNGAIAVARKRITFARVVDLEKTSLKKILSQKKFDVVLFADILEHIRYPERVLKECHDVLENNGRIIISIPNVANWSVRFSLLAGRFNYTDYGLLDKTHVRLYTLNTAKKLVKESGYSIVSIRYSASLVNLVREMVVGKKTSSVGASVVVPVVSSNKKSFISKGLKQVVESVDFWLTKLFPEMFAYQFIILAAKQRWR